MTEPIDVAYVEIRPTPGAKQEFKRDVEQLVEPAADGITRRVGKAVSDGVKSPVGSTAAGVAIGTVLGKGITDALHRTMRGVTLLPRTGFAELKDYQAGLAQLEAGLKSTGGVVGLTSGQMEALATSIQKYSGQTDDSIVKSESLLLTFDKIRDSVGAGNDVFTRATKSTADLAARLGGDAAGKAILLGKALNDPIAGLTALSRAGIQFDEGQKVTIRRLTESGRLLEAQKIVLAEVEKQVGGSARAYGETLPGQIDRGKRAFEDISQTIVGATFSFVEHNQKTTLALAGVVGGVYTAHKAVLVYRALQDTLFGSIPKKVAGNVALARSYDGVAASATRAAEAEGIAAKTGLGGGAAAAGARFGRFAGAGLVAGTAGALAYGAVKYGDKYLPDSLRSGKGGYLGDIDNLGDPKDYVRGPDGKYQLRSRMDFSPVNTQQLVDPRLSAAAQALNAARGDLNDPTKRGAYMSSMGGTLGGPFSTLADRTKGDPVAAREAQRTADRAVAEAQRAFAKAQEGGAGASRAQISSAEARVVAAQEAIRKRGGSDATEQARLEAAEAHLAELRDKGGVNADKLRAAEDRLKEARRNAGQAADATRKAEETTALSAKQVLDRLGGQLKNSKDLRDDARKLIENGVSRGVLESLQKLETEAPGTLDRVAKGMTPALAKQLNSQYASLQKVQQEFLLAPLRAAAEAAKAEQDKILQEQAKRQAEVYQQALRDNLFSDLDPNLPDPKTTALDPQEHGAPRVPGAVNVTLTGVRASTVHQIATSAVGEHDSLTALLIGPLS